MDVNKNTVVDYVAVTSGSEDDPPASRTPGTRAYVRLLIVMFALVLVVLLLALSAQPASGS